MTGNADDAIITYLSGERWTVKDTGFRDRPTRDEVAQLAYHLYEVRGRQHGYDTEDWLRAEQEASLHVGAICSA